MSDDTLTTAIGALRAAGDRDSNELAHETRVRLRRSLEHRAKQRRHFVTLATIVTVLLGGTMSWAVTTGRLAILSRSAAPAREVPPPKPAPHRPIASAAADPRSQPEAWPTEQVPPPPPPRAVPVHRPAPKPRPTPPVEALYRKAHDLHFHGGDYAAALAAWDEYLAGEPTGRFAIEARFNRALALIRLARYAEARLALQPFARGEVEPAGYRRDEAMQLLERLARITTPE